MKKNEYVSPEMEIMEITEQGSLLAGASNNGDMDGGIVGGGDDPD